MFYIKRLLMVDSTSLCVLLIVKRIINKKTAKLQYILAGDLKTIPNISDEQRGNE